MRETCIIYRGALYAAAALFWRSETEVWGEMRNVRERDGKCQNYFATLSLKFALVGKASKYQGSFREEGKKSIRTREQSSRWRREKKGASRRILR